MAALWAGGSCLLAGAADTAAPAPVPAKAPSTWKYSASAALKETYDSNVYLQSKTGKANQPSWVTSLTPQAGFGWNPSPLFGVNVNYAPEITWFHAESSEDNIAHRATVSLSSKMDKTVCESATSIVYIDGSSVGPTWTGPGGAPAAGGIAVRDRRDAVVYRSNLRVTQNIGKWFVRPGVWFYFHDFQTDQRTTTGYQNYADRDELLGGLDFGRRLTDKLTAWAGYRYGLQEQAKVLPTTDPATQVHYDSTFHRILFGVDGQVTTWLKVGLALGPEFRHYKDGVPTTFTHRNEDNLFVESSATLTPTKADTITISVKQFEQPGFGGRSVYEDLTYDAAWKHVFNKRWTAGIGGRAYNTDFLDPVKRNDWILSANVFINWAITPKLNGEVSYVFEDGLTHDINSSGREYKRNLVSLGVKYVFK